MSLSGHMAADITNLGNITVAGPLAVLTVGWLWWCGPRRLALAVGGSTFGALAVTVVLRYFSRLAGGELAGTPFRLTTGAPSGHTVTSTIIYGALAVLFCVGSRGLLRLVAVGLAVLAVAGVSITRVTLHVHSPGDVVAGLVLGGLFAIPVAIAARRQPDRWPPMAPLLLGVLAVALMMQWTGLRFVSDGIL